MPAAVVDAEGALKAYINSLTSLVGPGKPLAAGMWLGDGPRETERPRGGKGAYGLLSRVGGAPDATDEAPWDWPRLSAGIYGLTRMQAGTAAIAYANALWALDGTPQHVTWTPDGNVRRVDILAVQSITGPLWLPDGPEARYVVDAVVVCTPA